MTHRRQALPCPHDRRSSRTRPRKVAVIPADAGRAEVEKWWSFLYDDYGWATVAGVSFASASFADVGPIAAAP